MFQPDIEIEHHARLLQIRRLRESGLKYREIAAALGISAARLSQLRPQVDRLPHLEPLTPMTCVSPETELAYLPLSRRARSILAAAPFETVGDLMAAQGQRFGQETLPHCDPRSWREIRTCLGVLDAKGIAIGDAAAA